MFENSLPQASFFFFALVKFGEGFQEGGGEFFQVFDRIYTPEEQSNLHYSRDPNNRAGGIIGRGGTSGQI